MPAYKDRSLKDRKGEKWEDIPGLDGYYLVSNYGRVKRVRRELRRTDGNMYILREMIIIPCIMKAPNKHMNDLYHSFVYPSGNRR
ncbi:MAG: hypothetical protein KF746_27025 [Chitinophagaceae bacterium]|nr:hypothetical protein [Chitinophagaceae bacterium]